MLSVSPSSVVVQGAFCRQPLMSFFKRPFVSAAPASAQCDDVVVFRLISYVICFDKLLRSRTMLVVHCFVLKKILNWNSAWMEQDVTLAYWWTNKIISWTNQVKLAEQMRWNSFTKSDLFPALSSICATCSEFCVVASSASLPFLSSRTSLQIF